MHTVIVEPPKRQFVTVPQAIAELGVGKSTVYKWIRDSRGIVARDRYRIPDGNGRHVQRIVVDLVGLRAYGDTQIPGRPPAN